MPSIGETLKRLRGKRSLREMEKITGISHTYLSSLEKGVDPRTGKERKPTPETLRKIASALGVDYLELIEEAGYLSENYNERTKAHLMKIYETTRQNLISVQNELTNAGELLSEIKTYLTEEIARYQLPIAPDDFLETMERLIEELAKRIAEDVDNGDGFHSENENYFKVLDALMLFTEEGKKKFSAIKERAAQRKGELLLILQEEGLTYSGHLLTKEERQHILDMLAWSFRDKT